MSTTARRYSLSLFVILILSWAGPALAAAGVWTPAGPGAGWGWPNGLVSVTVHPAVPSAVWVGLPQGGLYRSADQGLNWRWVGEPFISDHQGVATVTADPSRPGALWAATRAGFFRTEDGGAHWARISGEDWPAVIGDEDLRGLVAMPGTLYLVLNRRLLASPDGGQTWTVLQNQGPDSAIVSFAVHPSAPRVLYLVVFGADGPDLLQSLDRGLTWTAVTTLPIPPERIEQVAATFGAVYVTVGGDTAGVLRSTDRGLTWRQVLGTPERPFHVTLEIDPRAPRTLYASGFVLRDDRSEPGLWVSRNAGSTWKKVGNQAVQLLRIDSAAGILYAIRDESLLRSRDGGATWTAVLRAPNPESSFARISFRPGDPARQALTVGFTLYRSVNGGQTWKLAGSPRDVRDVNIDPADPNRLIAVTSSSAWLSGNAGKTWKMVASNDLWYVELLVRADEQTLIAGGAGIHRSVDNGRTWQTVLPAWPRGANTGRWTQKIEVDPSDPSTIYALTFLAETLEPPHDVLSDLPSILWKSTDGGRTWRKMTLNLRTFAVDASSRLYGVRGRQILVSSDEGKHWQKAAQTPRLVHELVIDPADPNVLYAAAYGLPLARSRDRGATWELVSDAWMPLTLTFDPGNPRILYGADRWGVFKMKVPD